MNAQAIIYRSIRHHHPVIPAHAAWHMAYREAEVNRWVDQVGFIWDHSMLVEPNARWGECNFRMTAKMTTDVDGWDAIGRDDVGDFSGSWQPGAIRHSRNDPRILDWFIPADTEYARALYKRACDFGRGWEFQVLTVTAYRADIVLGRASLGGIESDMDESNIVDMVFDLKDEAIGEANDTLHKLCGCH